MINKNELKERLQSIYDDDNIVKNPDVLGDCFDAGVKCVLNLLNREYNLCIDFDTKKEKLYDIGMKKYFDFVEKITDKKIMTPHTNVLSEMAILNDEDFEKIALEELMGNFKK